MKTIAQRFDEFWIPEPNTGCHLWMACTNQNGYGVVRVGNRNMLAHREAFRRAGNPLSGHVLHRCDNPGCVNPDHLFVGTQADNVRDMDGKRRRRVAPKFGKQHWNCRISPELVVFIRTSSLPPVQIAKMHSITPEQVRNIRAGRQRNFG